MTSERELRVAEAVVDLGHRPPGFDPLELLHDLTAHLSALLPVRSAGVTTAAGSGEVAYLTASDEPCRRLEQDQIDLDEGPCLDSARNREPLPLTDLTDGSGAAARWPRFVPRARAAGITAVAAVMLETPPLSLGAANLLMSGPPYVDDRDLRLARTLTRATALAFAHRQERNGRDGVAGQLQAALDARLVVEQAKGVLAALLGVGMDEAFTLLRGHARLRGQRLTDLATRIARGDIPAALGGER
ncbi:ANTAR domain-containing protein [Streptomyces sp. ODS28]|uniref:ANTAR domain-containing protein n=1 Tax=Streptomyces sp. ODS28 TaxID=3136688 RepID=UPI0031E86633